MCEGFWKKKRPGTRWEQGSSGEPEEFFALLFGNKGSYWRQPLRKISVWSFSKELCSVPSVTARKTAPDCNKDLDQVSHNRAKRWLHLRDTESWRKEHSSGINQWCNTELLWSGHMAFLSSLSGGGPFCPLCLGEDVLCSSRQETKNHDWGPSGWI